MENIQGFCFILIVTVNSCAFNFSCFKLAYKSRFLFLTELLY